jgi:hypothetical protein
MSKSTSYIRFEPEVVTSHRASTLHDTLGWMIDGRLIAELVYVAVKLNIPALLREGPRTAADLVEATGANSDALRLGQLVEPGIYPAAFQKLGMGAFLGNALL